MDGSRAIAMAARAAAVVAAPSVATSDADLLAELSAWEELGRLVDGRRAAAAAEVARRSRPGLAEQGLAAREGEKGPEGLLVARLRVSDREARRRMSAGRHLTGGLTPSGAEIPARYPMVAESLQQGAVGLESGHLIVDMLQAVRRRADPGALDAAEAALVVAAATDSPDTLAVHVTTWEAALDPDGVEPTHGARYAARSVRIAPPGADGLATLIAKLPPEQLALMRALFTVHSRGIRWEQRVADGGDEADAPVWHEAEGDRRSRAQHDFDVLLGVVTAGLRATEREAAGEGVVPVTSPFEVLVHTTVERIESAEGQAVADDAPHPLPVAQAGTLACTGSSRVLEVHRGTGEALRLGKKQRLFTSGQRKALAAIYGGCAWPGCRAPASWSDVHHIRWWHRDQGPTDVDNGVLLCGFHHHLIHWKGCRWRIEVHDHRPHLVPEYWTGPPVPSHRMQRHRVRGGPAGERPSLAPPLGC